MVTPYETALQLWDWAGGALVLEEAGGRVVEMPPMDGFSAGLVAARAELCEPLHSLVTGAE